MWIRLLNDLHLEGDSATNKFQFTPLDTDPDTVVVLAGDIHNGAKAAEFIDTFHEQVRAVIYVPGNHEYWSVLYNEAVKDLGNIVRHNVHVLNDDSIEIDGVLFIGGTLWTGLKDNNPLVKLRAREYPDYCNILMEEKGKHRFITPDDVYEWHIRTRNFILGESNCNLNLKKVVVTHHAPTPKSIGKGYVNHPFNDFFANNFDLEKNYSNVDYWLHGHMHDFIDYKVGNTQVYCNPRGYVNLNQKTGFDPAFKFEIKT